MFIDNRDELIMEWKKVKEELAKAKALEADLRQEILSACFAYDPDLGKEGTEILGLGSGYGIKAVFKQTRRLENKAGETVEAIRKMAETFPEGKFIADRLVKWKPELSAAEYKNLPSEMRDIIDSVLVTKSAIPTLSFIEPK